MIKATTKIFPYGARLPCHQLPTLFKDAILFFARKLGIRYLWIDALCILQDDSKDWERESAVMAEVYSNPYLTIAATRAVNPYSSLLEDR